MPKRLTAALLASLTFAAVLAVVPLASPAAAHNQTKQQCAYDPFAGNQCWTVSVSHTHSCPSGTTGAYPNCYPAPSTNQQNKGDEEAKKAAEEARKKAEEEAKRKAAEEARKKAEEEAKRKADEEAERKRKEAEEAKKKNGGGSGGRRGLKNCSTGQHRHDDGHDCTSGHTHDDDDGTGTGTGASDPCGDYAEDLVDALSKAAHTGTYNPPTKPDGCDGPSTSETVGAVSDFFKRVLAWWGSEEQKRSEFTREVSRAHIENLQELWNAIPEDERETLIDTGTSIGLGSACLALTMGEETTSLTPGAQAASAHLSAAAISVCVAALGKLVDAVGGDDGDGQQLDPDNADDDSAQQPNDPRPGDDDSDTPSTPEEWDQAVKEAEEKWRRNEIEGDEVTRIQNLRDCAYGHPWAQNCP